MAVEREFRGQFASRLAITSTSCSVIVRRSRLVSPVVGALQDVALEFHHRHHRVAHSSGLDRIGVTEQLWQQRRHDLP